MEVLTFREEEPACAFGHAIDRLELENSEGVVKLYGTGPFATGEAGGESLICVPLKRVPELIRAMQAVLMEDKG